MTAIWHRLSAQRLMATLLIVFLAACETVDSPPPGRVGYEDGSRPTPVEETPEPVVVIPRDDIPGLDPIDAVLFEPVEEALARGDWVAATLAMPVPAETAAPNPQSTEPTAEPAWLGADAGREQVPAASDAAEPAPTSLDLWIDY